MSAKSPLVRWSLFAAILFIAGAAFLFLIRYERPQPPHPTFGPVHVTSMKEAGDRSNWDGFVRMIRQDVFRHPPLPYPSLDIGPHEMEWSLANNRPPRTGYLYYVDPGSTNEWEFALCSHTNLLEISTDDFNQIFFRQSDAQTPDILPKRWGKNALHVTEGEIILARHTTEPTTAYAIQLAKQDGTSRWGQIRIHYFQVTNAPIAIADKTASPDQ